MKSSPSTATVLILIMLLMVVAAGFVFLFQAELDFRNHLRDLTAEKETLEANQANLQLEISGAMATRNTLATDLAAAEGERDRLKSQLVESRQEVDKLKAEAAIRATEAAQLTTDLETLEGEQQSRPPVARIVIPAEKVTLPISQPVEIVVAASDDAGLSSITLDVNGTIICCENDLDAAKLFAHTLDWNARDEVGDVVFTISAVNINDVRSEPHKVTITLADTEARN